MTCRPASRARAYVSRNERRGKLRLEAAQADADDQAAPGALQCDREHGALRLRLFARDVGDEGDARAREAVAARAAARQRVEDSLSVESSQMQRHADEALGVAHVLARLVDVEFLDEQREVVDLRTQSTVAR